MTEELTPEKVLDMIKSNNECENAIFLMWNFASDLGNPFLFIDALTLMTAKKNETENSFSNHPDTLDFLFDHYFIMLDSGPISNPTHVSTRIHLIEMLCHLLIYHPDKISCFDSYLCQIWRKLLSMMKRTASLLQIAAFRSATDLFKKCYDQIGEDRQPFWLMNLIEANPPSSPLHIPSIRFAMQIRPTKFGFVSLCNTIIRQGINQPQDLGIISHILMLPVIKDPTDTLQYLCRLAVSGSYLAGAARKALKKPLAKFQELPSFVPWFKLFLKRCIEFVGFAQRIKKYKVRRYNIAQFCDMLLDLNIIYMTEIILQAVNTIQSLQLGINIFAFIREKSFAASINQNIDEKIKEEMETKVENIDLKNFFLLEKIKITLPLLVNESNGKMTVSQAKARYLNSKKQASQIQTTDLDALDDLPGPPSQRTNDPPQIPKSNSQGESCNLQSLGSSSDDDSTHENFQMEK